MHWPRSADSGGRDPLTVGLNQRPLVDVPGNYGVGVHLGQVLSELARPASRAAATAKAVVIPEAMQCRCFSSHCPKQHPACIAALPYWRACNAEPLDQPGGQASLLPLAYR